MPNTDKMPEEVAPQDADTQTNDEPNPKPSLINRVKYAVRRHGLLSGACVLSFCTGMLLSVFSSGDVPEVAQEELTPAPPKYVAAVSRRHEPISPLVPFDGLDSEVVALGKRLFSDPALSGNGRVACASCHNTAEGGDDGLPVPIGIHGEPGRFNSLTVINAALNFSLGWDGTARSLEDQIDIHLLNQDEMDSDWDRVVKYLSSEASYSRPFRVYLGGLPTPERVRTALATYERSLITVDSKFDRWLEGEESALTTDELSGYYSFLKLNCISCHQGPGVGGSMFQPLGPLREFLTSTRGESESDLGRFHVTEEEQDRYVFRVPTLRNVERTAPYFHDGSVATLEEAVAAMMHYQCGQEDPNQEEVRRITLFLKTLAGSLLKPPPPPSPIL